MRIKGRIEVLECIVKFGKTLYFMVISSEQKVMKGTSQRIIKIVCLAVFAVYYAGLVVTATQVTNTFRAAKSGGQSRPELVPQTGHSSSINAVVFDPNNQWVATGSTDSTVIIWEI